MDKPHKRALVTQSKKDVSKRRRTVNIGSRGDGNLLSSSSDSDESTNSDGSDHDNIQSDGSNHGNIQSNGSDHDNIQSDGNRGEHGSAQSDENASDHSSVPSSASGSISDHDGSNSDVPCDSDSSRGYDSDENDQNVNQDAANLGPPVDNPEGYLHDSLQQLALRGVSKAKVTELLHLLKPVYPDLPLDARTLLNTPRSTNTYEVGLEDLWYKGILSNIELRASDEYLQTHDSIEIDISIDGVNAYGMSCTAKFWPILGCLDDDDKPFVVGCYFGNSGKSDDLEAYLGEFSREVARLTADGILLNERRVPFSVRSYIMDVHHFVIYVRGSGLDETRATGILMKKLFCNALVFRGMAQVAQNAWI